MVFIKKFVKFSSLFLLGSILLGAKVPEKQQSKSPDYVGFVDEVIYTFIKEVNEEFGFICDGTGGSMPYDVLDVYIGFIAYRKATLEEARELEVKLIEKFLRIVNSYEEIHPYLREYPFTGGRVEVSISFLKKNNEPQIKDSVYLVSQTRNKLFYYRDDPKTNTSIKIAEESYEDARKIVQKNLSTFEQGV